MAFTTDPTTGELLDEFGNPVGPSSGGAGRVAPNPALSGAGGGPGLVTDPGYVAPDLPPAPPRPVAPPMGGLAPPLPGLPPLPAAGAGGMVKQSSTTTSVNETKEEKRLHAEQAHARTEFEKATEQLAKPTTQDRLLTERTNTVNTQAAQDAVAAEEARKAAADAALAERDRVARERNDKIAQVQAASEAEKQKYAGMKIRDYFEEGAPGEGKKGQMLLGILMSGIGQAIARDKGNNPALDQMNLQIERFRKSEQARIEQQAEAWKMGRMSVEDAERQKAAELHDLDARTAAVRETIAQEARTKAAARGLSVAQIENDSAIQKLDKAALTADQERQQRAMQYVDKDLAHAASLRSSTTTTNVHQDGAAGGKGAGALTGPQATVAAAIDTLVGSLDRISKLPQLSTKDLERIQDNETALKNADGSKGITGTVGTLLGRAAKIVPRNPVQGLNPQKAEVYQEYLTVRETIGNIISGLNLPEDQARRISSMVTPLPGEDPKAWKAKAARAISFAKSHSVGAGALAPALNQRLDAVQGQFNAVDRPAPGRAAAGPPPGAIPGVYKGVKGYRLGNKFYPEEATQ